MGHSEEIGPVSAMEIDSAKRDAYEVRPRKDKRGFDLISDALPFGRLWYLSRRSLCEGG